MVGTKESDAIFTNIIGIVRSVSCPSSPGILGACEHYGRSSPVRYRLLAGQAF